MSVEEAAECIHNFNISQKDLIEKQQEKEEKLRKIDPEKAQQVERLGMGFIEKSSSSRISHSAVGDMKVIEQVNPTSSKSSRNIDRDLGLYDSDPFSRISSFKKSSLDDKDDFWACLDSPTSSSLKGSKVPQVIDTIPALETSPTRISRQAMAFGSSSPSHGSSLTTESSSSSSQSNKYTHPMDSEAQKKFGQAKGISSAQFFGDQNASSFEERARINQFQGASSLSSDEYFGRNTNKPQSTYSNLSGTNLYDIKEGVKDSVTKVASRLSNMASNLASSFAESGKFDGF